MKTPVYKLNEPPKRFDFSAVLKKASTYVAALVASAGTFMGWYISQPPQIQESVPQWAVSLSVTVVMLNVVLTPLATSFKQKNLG